MKKVATNTIDAGLLAKMFLAGAKNLEVKKEWINELNVFPVPDGDTGINMSATINAAARELEKGGDGTLGEVAETAAMCMLRGARGNSGVITSLLFRGFSKRVKGLESGDALVLAEALREGVDAAYKAVMRPAEGTILTVSMKAAQAAIEAAKATGSLRACRDDAAEPGAQESRRCGRGRRGVRHDSRCDARLYARRDGRAHGGGGHAVGHEPLRRI